MPESEQHKLSKSAIRELLGNQRLLDTSLTLGELMERSQGLSGRDELAGYTFAWDKYVFDVAVTGEEVSRPAERRQVPEAVLNMNERVQELVKLAASGGIDEVAGYVFTSDKYTFIVGVEEQVSRPIRDRPRPQ